VDSLDRLDELAPKLTSLGRRHAGYGVREAHYETVGAALLWTSSRGWGRTSRRRYARPGPAPMRCSPRR
jgi:hemoglobin-like flavoprotein